MKCPALSIALVVFIITSSCHGEDSSKGKIKTITNQHIPIKDTPVQIHNADTVPPLTQLFEAIKNNDKSTIKKLVLSGCDVNGKINEGQVGEDVPLRKAVYYCDTSIIKFLLEHGANPNIKRYRGTTPTHYAAGYDNAKYKLLIRYGGNVNTFCSSCSISVTPFSRALYHDNIKNIKTMLNAAYNIEPDSTNGFRSALSEAISFENFEAIDLLISAGADLNVVFSEGGEGAFCINPSKITPLHKLSVRYSHTRNQEKIEQLIARLIKSGANINAKNYDGQTPLDFAACNNDTILIAFLLHHGADYNNAVYYASLKSSFSSVKLLLEKGANPNIIVDGATPLIACITCCGDGFGEGIKYDMRIKTIEYLINFGGDVNIKDKYNKSFMDYVKSGTYNVYEYFIENESLSWDDININFYGNYDRTEIIEFDSTKVWMQPNTRSPVISYLMKSDTVIIRRSGKMITDGNTNNQNSWIQIKFQDTIGFLLCGKPGFIFD